MSSHHSSREKKTPSENTISNYFEESAITSWISDAISQYGKYLLYSLIFLLGVVVAFYLLSSRRTDQAEKDYFQAARDFTYFSKHAEAKDEPQTKEALRRLKMLLAAHPELHAIYDGRLAQIFLNQKQTNEAMPYAIASLARVKSNSLTFYSDYAETTLLISENKFQKAFENTQALQQKMNDHLMLPAAERPFGEELFALNLLRIGILQQELGDKNGELKTWQEWKHYAGLGEKTSSSQLSSQAFRYLIQKLAVGAVSIPDYILQRENILKK